MRHLSVGFVFILPSLYLALVTLALAGWSAYASQPTNFYIDRVLEFLITTKLFQPS